MKKWEEQVGRSSIDMQKKEPIQASFSDRECRQAAVKAMDLLLHKDRTCRELSDRLVKDGYSEQAVKEALAYVQCFGYIDDSRYVENYLMFQQDKRSKKEILYKLAEKGISGELVHQVMEMADYHGEEQAVEQLIRKRLKGKSVHEISASEKNKIFSYLARRGFNGYVVRNVFSKLDNCS